MPSNALHKASDLPPDIQQAVARLLGRPLEPEEHISIMAYPPHKAPAGRERAELARRLSERIDKTAAKVRDVPEAELDELIDEAVVTLSRCPCRSRRGLRFNKPAPREPVVSEKCVETATASACFWAA
jgi:L-lactate utilization protein LutC